MTFTVKQADKNHIQPVLTHKFKNHLDNSSKVFFSGAYGMGKTTYLQNRFNKEEGDLRQEYIAFHLFPVNYVVADNKDIFELIKYDLLYQLLDYVDFNELFKTDSIYKNHLAQFVSENYSDLFFHFLTSFPLFGGSVEKIKSNLESLVKKFEESKPTTTETKIKSFIDEISIQKGSIYENDFYTKLIFGIIEEITNNSNKKTVLIIDDLDRIDPNHIFRILNIFSAHVDCNSLMDGVSNKFNIDKVIVVGDYANIKSIFHHIYGVKTDFNGYIDKFYSTEIYQLSFEDKMLNTFYNKFSHHDQKYALLFISLVLTILHDNNKFNLRQFHKLDSILEEHTSGLNHSFFEVLLRVYNNDLSLLISNLESCNLQLKKYSRNYVQYEDIYNNMVLSKVKNSNLSFVTVDNSELIIEINKSKYFYKPESYHRFIPTENSSKLDLYGSWYLIIEIFKVGNFNSE
jgi:hypothetical protein